jgi:signal transduction histidine kinase
LDAVRRIAASVSTSTNTDDIVREALVISLELVKADAGSVLLYLPEENALVFKYVFGEAADKLTGTKLDAGTGLAGTVFQTGKTLISQDVSKEAVHDTRIDAKTGFSTRNMVTVSMKTPTGESLGVMQILNKCEGLFEEQDVNLIEIMAAQSAIAIETSRLYERARLATIMKFIGNISHDVKNMITPSMTGAQTLQMIADDCFSRLDNMLLKPEIRTSELADAISELKETYPEMIAMILESADVVQQRMAEISAVVKGMISTPSFATTDMVMVAQRIQSMLALVAHKKGVNLALETDADVIMAEVDPKQIYNAIYNLVLNAIDACSQGDSVTFHIGSRQSAEGEQIVMECIDTGPGMPEHVRAKAFTTDAVSTKPMGTGLGTKIVKNVIDSHNGTIEVISEEGHGTTIRCIIPANHAVSA